MRLNGLSGVPAVRRRRLLHNFTIRYQGSCRIVRGDIVPISQLYAHTHTRTCIHVHISFFSTFQLIIIPLKFVPRLEFSPISMYFQKTH